MNDLLNLNDLNYHIYTKAIEILSNKTALVICGGGTSEFAVVESLDRLTSLGLRLEKIKSVTGSSAGALISTIIACKGSISYIKNKMYSLNSRGFLDPSCCLVKGVKLLNKYGLNGRNNLKNIIIDVLLELLGNADYTFKQLYDLTGIHLTITYLSLNYERTMYADYINEPDTLVRKAILKSCSIPVFYEANFENKDGYVFVDVDGGTQNNYPMNVPRSQKIDPIHILGLKLIAPKDMTDIDNGGNEPLVNRGPPRGLVDYLTRIISILREQAMKVHVSENDWKLTVKINVGNYTATDFDLTQDDKIKLAECGRIAANNYIVELMKFIENNISFV